MAPPGRRFEQSAPIASTSAVKLDAPIALSRQAEAQHAAVTESPSKRAKELPRQRSRGQIARRQSITRGTDRLGRGTTHSTARSDDGFAGYTGPRSPSTDEDGDQRSDAGRFNIFGIRSSTSTLQSSQNTSAKSSRGPKQDRSSSIGQRRRKSHHRSNSKGVLHRTEQPWLGGLYFTDVVFIAFTYAINLLRTCGLAEIADVAFKGMVYALTSLPIDLYRRWTLSTPSRNSDYESRHAAARIKRRKLRRGKARHMGQGQDTVLQPSTSESEGADATLQPDVFASSSSKATGDVVEQLSPFHHLVILLSRFACGHFPHLLPRILFAEETIGPFVYWRTGGGSNAMVREFSDLSQRSTPLIQDDLRGPVRPPSSKTVEPGFRAYLLSKDVTVPTEVQRANLASQRATTLLYLHGGGFSLGSVAFYAEALLRVRAKIALLEAEAAQAQGKSQTASLGEARCVAVEYDLSPSARFPIPLLQCLRCYAYLVEVEKIDPESICVAGDSAGGNLAMTMLLCLSGQIRDDPAVPELHERDWSRLPMPGKAVLISPWVDLRPSTARAFACLRGQQGRTTEQKHRDASLAEQTGAERHHDDGAADQKTWTEAVARYDWDFVASEALLHFAQVYAGVLPTPRRVYGPLGWIAHICGVLALGESPTQSDAEGDSPSDTSSAPWPYQLKGMMDPTRALSALSRPTRRLAKATHNLLTDPMLARLVGSPMASNEEGVISEQTSPLSGLEPLFTAEDRRTCLVGDKLKLFEPVDAPFAATPAEKIGADGTPLSTRQRGLNLLETHPLLNPALGDWSKIHLKHGCLVTWGERERMAADIEAWIDSVPAPSPNDPASGRGDTPVQDQLPQEVQRNSEGGQGGSRSAKYSGTDADWIYVAVEKGPGGVHAWPFVSMYLAGSERERERGLDLLAQFAARLPEDLRGSEGDQRLGEQTEQELLQRTFELQSMQAAPESPDNDDAASVGSMPSDVDLHGTVDDDEGRVGGGPQHIFWTSMSSPTIDVAEAVRRASRREMGGCESSDSTSPISQRLPSTSPRAISSASRKKQHDSSVIQLSLPTNRQKGKRTTQGKSQQPKAGNLSSSSSDDASGRASEGQLTPRAKRPWPSQPPQRSPKNKERGRSRSPRRSPALSSPGLTQPSAFTQSLDSSRPTFSRTGSGSSTSSSSALSHVAGAPSAASAQLLKPTEDAAPLSSQPTLSDDHRGESTTAFTRQVCAVDDDDVPIPRVPRYGLDDITEVSSEDAFSPRPRPLSLSRSPERSSPDVRQDLEISSPRKDQQEEQTHSEPAMKQQSGDSTHETEDSDTPRSFMLSQYAVHRPEPEGLSDIAEEGSILSASYTSGAELRSRSVSPIGQFHDAHRCGQAAASLLGAATQVMQGSATDADGSKTPSYATAAARPVPQPAKQWRYLRDEIPMTHNQRKVDGRVRDDEAMSSEVDTDDDDGYDGDIASSPPAGVQPGPSLRTISSSSSLRSQQNNDQNLPEDSLDQSSLGGSDSRKKPKGDVWWA